MNINSFIRLFVKLVCASVMLALIGEALNVQFSIWVYVCLGAYIGISHPDKVIL